MKKIKALSLSIMSLLLGSSFVLSSGVQAYASTVTTAPKTTTTTATTTVATTINPNTIPVDSGLNLGGVLETVSSNYYYNSATYKYVYPDTAFHSTFEKNIYNYMLNTANDVSVHNTAIKLHGGITTNNCTYFTSEILRRMGMTNVPTSTSLVTQVQTILQQNGFKTDKNLANLKPGDICFTQGYTHVYTFMGWVKSGQYTYAYVVDNQARLFSGHVLHVRRIDAYEASKDTDPIAFFMYK